MYAVVEAGGKQYQLESGRFVDVEMIPGEPSASYVFERVLMIVDGDKSLVGKPVVEGARVTGRIISHVRGPRLVVFKYRAKKGTRKRSGHRQGYTRLFVESIAVADNVLSQATDKKAAEKASSN
jgi:large subunit ribosomal protein L21